MRAASPPESRGCPLAGVVRPLLTAAAASLALAALCAGLTPARAAEGYSEEGVEAAYLYRFAGYVNWPALPSANQPFVIAILDSSGVARELRRLLPGHRIDNHVAQVREVTGMKDLGNPQILYVGPGHAELLRLMQPALAQRHMLLVTAEERGLDAGSTLNFVVIDHRVRFEVSLTAADRSGLRISSELLGVAVRVLGGGRQSREGCSPFVSPDAIGDGCRVVLAGRVEIGAPHCRDRVG
jgi:hypothetical protein